MAHYDKFREEQVDKQREEKMRTSNEGKVEIIGHEGIALSKYKDSVGVWTIAGGATRSEIPDIASWPLSKTITMQEAFDLFGRSIVKYENAINKALTRPIQQYQFDALVSWCYNVGVGYTQPVYDKKGNMTRDTATVLKLLNRGASGVDLFKALMMYRKPPEIIGRRTKEANLLAYGKYSNNGKAMLFPVSSKGYPVYGRGTSINVWQYIPHTVEVEPVVPEVHLDEEQQLQSKPPTLLQKGVMAITTLISDYLNRGGKI